MLGAWNPKITIPLVLIVTSASLTQTSMANPTSCAAVTGTVTYRQRSALPPNAVVEVKLLDVSLQDVPAVVLAKQTIATKGRQVPIPFQLAYKATLIKPEHIYTVQAQILVDGQLWFTNASAYRVITQNHPTTIEVVVQPARG
jgi:putative lipoprotein